MRMILAATMLLAACGGAATDNKAGNSAAPEAANISAPANVAAPADPTAAARRADMIRECSDDVRTELPEGADLEAFCGCAVDRMQGGNSGEREAMDQCAAQMGIPPRR